MNNTIDAIYIHIPFCTSICSYCDFCKIFYQSKYIDAYLDALEKEIKTYYNNELIRTIYIGGGTPSSLSLNELERLLNITKLFKCDKNIEFTIELNIEHITEDLLKLLYKYQVNRLSIGIQTLNHKLLKFLNRHHSCEEVISKIKMAKEIGFNNINVDLIYAIPNQTKEDLKEDLNILLNLGITHISTYSLMIEPQTLLYINNIKPIDETLDYEMYQMVDEILTQNHFKHYEISNYCKEGYESKHNLRYWNNREYYGFGMGASGYVNNVYYTNTRNINEYLKFYYRKEETFIDFETKMENEFILGLRKTEGINKNDFYNKYNLDIYSIPNVEKLVKEGKLIDNGTNIFINPEYLYISNEILINFVR